MGDVGDATTEISPDLINNIDPNDITYDYDVRLYEAHHDLYIEVYYKGKGGSVTIINSDVLAVGGGDGARAIGHGHDTDETNGTLTLGGNMSVF